MLRFVFLIVLIGFASADVLDTMVGSTWTNVVEYTNDTFDHKPCEPTKLEATQDSCTCGTRAVPVFKFTPKIGGKELSPFKKPAVAVRTLEEAQEGVQLRCDCKGKAEDKLLTFRPLSKNYMLFYPSGNKVQTFLLVAKDVPTEAKLKDFMKNNDVLKDFSGYITCTKETLESESLASSNI